jgi:hypothetical protein
MDSFTQTLLDWQLFFATVATAAAALTGLLFVSLSLNRDRLKGTRAADVISIARNTFGDFLYVLMISLVFLVPHPVPLGLTVALLVLGLASGAGIIVREASRPRRRRKRMNQLKLILRRIGLPALASIGLIVVAIEIALDHYVAIYGLVAVIAALLVTACWNAWQLLLEEKGFITSDGANYLTKKPSPLFSSRANFTRRVASVLRERS